MLGDEIRRAARDVDVFADEVAVDAGDEVIRIEIEASSTFAFNFAAM